MDITLFDALLLIVAGLFAGFINTLAGSGSLITLPLLMFLGLSPHQANATNRVAIFFQTLVAVRNFEKQKTLDIKQNLSLVIPALIGSAVGATLAININEELLNAFIGGLLFVMFFVILFKPERWVKEQAGSVDAKPTFWRIIIFFGIGLYGGFIQAGVGFFLLAGLVLGVGYDLIRANAVKVLIVFCYTALALGIFMWSGQVNYLFGIVLAIGNASGAYIASRYSKQIGTKYIRYILLVAVMLAALKVLGVFELLF
ncbi:sulfite exporter TauE/SafE family protein [Carboxylicivirga sp. N1Y90]|uniref:sulfite exporter TauE/SafE family protein n=1 Tax=Carboxylicivirga fragile TaxID=3417571 RepID=UPI003D332C94|nr:sulfite exporter TauE/SafE family protein [Marinilabiliaceae bacterium N1Y90]